VPKRKKKKGSKSPLSSGIHLGHTIVLGRSTEGNIRVNSKERRTSEVRENWRAGEKITIQIRKALLATLGGETRPDRQKNQMGVTLLRKNHCWEDQGGKPPPLKKGGTIKKKEY